MSLPLLATTHQLLFTLDGWMPCSPAHSSRESKDNSHCIFGPMYLGIFLLCASYSWTTGGDGNSREGTGRDHTEWWGQRTLYVSWNLPDTCILHTVLQLVRLLLPHTQKLKRAILLCIFQEWSRRWKVMARAAFCLWISLAKSEVRGCFLHKEEKSK